MGASQRIGIFGGSFNPPHNGHLGACHYLMERKAVDQIIVIPCWVHPFHKTLASFVHRVAMCRLAFEGLPDVTISEIERELGDTSHTIHTVRAIRRHHPTAHLFLIIGADLLPETPLWHDVETLRTMADFLPLPRGEESPIPDVSATGIRQRLADHAPINDLVPAAVAAYIHAHQVY